MKIADSIIDLIGKTPLVALNRLSKGLPGQVIGKLESRNPAFSVKDRIGYAMITAAEKSGEINQDTVIIAFHFLINFGSNASQATAVKSSAH